MTALDRLLTEAIPDGTFGGRRTPAERVLPATTPAAAARHLAELADAIGAPHLTAVPDQPEPTQPDSHRSAA